jgi:hypothetical protein
MLAVSLVALSCGAASCGEKPRVRMPRTLPPRPVVWPFARNLNVVQIRPALLRGPGARPSGGQGRSLVTKLLDRLTGLRRLARRCQLTGGDRVERVLVGFGAFDRIYQGAVVALQGALDARQVVRCARAARKLGPKPFRFGPYEGVKGAIGSRGIRLFALAQDTVVIAVSGEARRAVQVVRGVKRGLRRRHREVHFSQGARSAATTLTVSRLLHAGDSLLTSPLMWAIKLLHGGWMQAYLPGRDQVRIRGRLRARGKISAVRLMLRWKVLTALIRRLSADADLVLSAAVVERDGRWVNLRVDAGAAERRAFERLFGKAMGKLGRERRGPDSGPAQTPPSPPGDGAPPGDAAPPGDTAPSGDPAPPGDAASPGDRAPPGDRSPPADDDAGAPPPPPGP